MAAPSRTENVPITWSGSNSIALAGGTTGSSSDAVALDADVWAAEVQVYVTLSGGTAAAWDSVDVFILYNGGNILGDSQDSFDTRFHAENGVRLYCHTGDLNGETAPQSSFPVRTASKGFKIRVRNNCPAARTATVRLVLVTQKPW